MPIKGLQSLPFVGACILAGTASWITASWADERPQSMLGAFDLKSVILSPEPLGPPSQFKPPDDQAEPAAAQAEVEPQRDKAAAAETDAKAQATAEAEAKPKAVAKPKAAAKPKVAKTDDPPRKKVSSRPRSKPAVAAHKRKTDPLDAYARDTRGQTWPCVGDGICDWKQPR